MNKAVLEGRGLHPSFFGHSMSVIVIREQQKTHTGFTATLSFDGRGNYPITITDPFTPKDEQQLEWYYRSVYAQRRTTVRVVL
jgi:hypothetical protein